MLRKRERPAFDKIDTFIGKDTAFQGKMVATGTVRIDGVLKGEVYTKGDLVIGEQGSLEANLKARNILVAGSFKGNIIASGKVEVAATGKILGDIRVGSLSVDDGAVFQGNCQMTATDKVMDDKVMDKNNPLKLEHV